MFWTDGQQAAERLNNSYVLFGNVPAYVERIEDGNNARISVMPKGTREIVPLADDRFEKFRKLPPMGWSNVRFRKSAVLLNRVPRRSRVHGLNNENVSVQFLNKNEAFERSLDFSDVVRDEGYLLSCQSDFPVLEDVLLLIKNAGVLAISSKYAVFRDNIGLRWLFRNRERIGLFSGTDTLLVLDTFKYLKEELIESPEITVANIKEF